MFVTVRYERLQNYCYNCGRIGHDSRNCKFQTDATEIEDEENRPGSGLGTVHVKMIEDVIVIHDNTWDEAAMIRRKPPPATDQTHSHRRINVDARSRNSAIQGVETGIQLLHHEKITNGTLRFNDGVTEPIQKESKTNLLPKITELSPEIPQPQSQGVKSGCPPLRQEGIINGTASIEDAVTEMIQREFEFPVSPSITELNPELLQPPPDSSTSPTIPMEAIYTINIPIPISQEPQHQPSLNFSNSLNLPNSYRVDFPDDENDGHSANISFVGLSPVSAVTTGLNRINLKRAPDHLAEDERPNPPKKCLTFLEQEPDALPCETGAASSGGAKRMTMQKLKKSM
ncbi:hypothetical protein K1719_015989 [Acacia pycnantha]|nr:hypothetical protein K1719_015989 [Acacia pycnantha]